MDGLMTTSSSVVCVWQATILSVLTPPVYTPHDYHILQREWVTFIIYAQVHWPTNELQVQYEGA